MLDEGDKTLDARGLRALAHPVRMRLLRELSLGEAKVSDLATAVHEPANSVSFHLRQLEKYGFVRHCDGPPGASRKESWWASAQQQMSIGAEALGDGDEGTQAREALMATLRVNAIERVERICASILAYREHGDPPPELSGVTSEWPLLLTAEEHRELTEELEALYAKWGSRTAPRGRPARRYTLALDLFPEPPETAEREAPATSADDIDGAPEA